MAGEFLGDTLRCILLLMLTPLLDAGYGVART